MEVAAALGGIGPAFGLSTSAGLNAYIPLLLVALAARFPADDPLIKLAEPFHLLSSWWIIGLLVLLLVIEMTVDKIPVVDSINDVIQTLIRPAAGAILFAASADVITDISPIVPLVAGILLAGTVHAVKGVARPAITATTAGTGNWLVSLVEDIIATITSILAILIPIIGILLFAFVLVMVIVFIRRRRRRKELAYH